MSLHNKNPSPLPWYLSEIQEAGDIKYLIRSEDRNQFPTWIAELSNQEDHGLKNGELIVKAVNNHAALLAACKHAESRLEWIIDYTRRTGSSLLMASTEQATRKGELMIREAKELGKALGPIVKAIVDCKGDMPSGPQCACPSVACPVHGLPNGSASGGW